MVLKLSMTVYCRRHNLSA